MEKSDEQNRIQARFFEVDFLEALVWAARSAIQRVKDDHSAEAGYNSRTFGNNFREILLDRLHRVFSTHAYTLPQDAAPNSGQDVVYAELSREEIETMPLISPGLITFSEVRQSPVWHYKEIRLFLQSAGSNSFDKMGWNHSRVKREIACAPYCPDTITSPLQTEIDLFGKVHPNSTVPPNAIPLVFAYKVNQFEGLCGLTIGRPKDDTLKTGSWHWRLPIDTELVLNTNQRHTAQPEVRDQTEDTKISLRTDEAQNSPGNL